MPMRIQQRHFRRLEAPSGAGTIHHGENHLANVRYGLRVLQEIIGTRQRSSASAVKGVLQIAGSFCVTSGSQPFEGDHLTLRLADGRSLSLLVVGDGPHYTIDPTGGLR